VQIADAAALIKDAVGGREGVWADLGAGRGTFTRALAQLLDAESRIYAIDRDSQALAELESWAKAEAPNVTVLRADFTKEIEIPDAQAGLDGILLANALHFVKDASALLTRLTSMLRPGGCIVLVEYDRRAASRWVPYPVSIAHLPALAAAAGLTRFTVVESRPSNYEGIIYAAVALRIDPNQSSALH
jgi:trans-aconitate methyltransferase